MDRVSTGIPGLDAVTGGGFLRSGVYILQGAPGAGKTILANQVVHRHAAAGGHVVYVTMLAESHGRLLQHMEPFSFFDLASLPDKVYYVSAFDALRTGGLKAVVELLRNEMRSREAGIVVLDGLVMAASAAESEEELKLFVSDIQAHSTLTGSTTLLLTSEHADRPVSAEQTMVDGILLLRERAFGPRRERNIEVVKFRGSSTLRGNHAFQIGPDGITVYPRLETARREHAGDAVLPVGVSTGVAGLDAMFDIGGYGQGSITAVTGPSGAGKTALALQFVSRATPEDKAVYFSFYESPPLLLRVMELLGVAAPDPAAIDFRWQPFGETVLDRMASELLEAVQSSRASRVVIDGVGGFLAAPAYAERNGPFVAALANELRRLGATTIVTLEESEATGTRIVDTPTLSALADTTLQLSVRTEGSTRRFATIRKSRVSRCDLRVRELVLTPAGIEVRQEDPVAP
nr:ATPase domain-containing protein [Ramlibacter cellulosilyticus]